ncbi:uncharacterized protein RAG0_14754 [Rhynchosporium agropyri]|uniref:ubiquitinyl hydrolase 1 n=1 Tax=Rhynchosporium agropyri TaxID=914238 RepID=A0A1E1LI75_9HELO|nr:uncharacterized protein RAG0_14754 [Rhynchosporium agropyri]
MNNFVFPLHAKQFGIKLQASGWDLPLFYQTATGEIARARTTGFSGTNDNKMMLPLNIRQDDLPTLSQTNAEVLTYLLAPRNRRYIRAALDDKRLTEESLLRILKKEEIKILIDAGAHILEMNNETLVTKWLEIYPNANGAVYFGDDNRALVKYRGGKNPVPLLATPFADNLDRCLVYIDEAHTRGIDLKLPQYARGALTLALGQTKDHTVQAAMRLRQLGTTQSVTFFAPPEVHQSILDVCSTQNSSVIDSSHVVTWLLEQTCLVNEHLQNLYVSQGMDFCRRTNAQWTNVRFLADKNHRKSFLEFIQQPELQTLEQLYGAAETQHHTLTEVSFSQLKPFVDELTIQRRAARANGKGAHSYVLQEVEQEREVEFQVEEVRQIQKRIHYDAHIFPGLHEEISRFVKTGQICGEGGAFEHAFEALARTQIGKKHSLRVTNSGLYVSSEFSRTIKVTGKKTPQDDFLCHLIAYAAPVTKNMTHFNSLSYYVVPHLPPAHKFPDWLSIELGIFAGRLYFDFAERSSLLRYLQLDTYSSSQGSADMDSPSENSSSSAEALVLKANNPVNFLLEWLTLCRKGQDIMHTPIGYICQGRQLHELHPFFMKRGNVDGVESTDGLGSGEGSVRGSECQSPLVDYDSDFKYEYD